jgi:hypothetical protein
LAAAQLLLVTVDDLDVSRYFIVHVRGKVECLARYRSNASRRLIGQNHEQKIILSIPNNPDLAGI